MSCTIHPEPGPGLVARELPRAAVTVQDPTGRHRFFSTRRQGIRFGANMAGNTVWTVCVSVEGRDYLVPPSFVLSDVSSLPIERKPMGAVVIPFPPGGRRGGTR